MRAAECPLCKVPYVPAAIVIPIQHSILLPNATVTALTVAAGPPPITDASGQRFYRIMCCTFIVFVFVISVGSLSFTFARQA